MALNRFLSEISDVQLASGVRQRAPTTLDPAVAATLELETYLHKSSPFVVSVNAKSNVVIAESQRNGIEESLQELLERMDKLEGALAASKDSRQYRGFQHGYGGDGYNRGKRKVVCWKCREEGHFARNCKKAPEEQGNGTPSGQ